MLNPDPPIDVIFRNKKVKKVNEKVNFLLRKSKKSKRLNETSKKLIPCVKIEIFLLFPESRYIILIYVGLSRRRIVQFLEF